MKVVAKKRHRFNGVRNLGDVYECSAAQFRLLFRLGWADVAPEEQEEEQEQPEEQAEQANVESAPKETPKTKAKK